METKTNCILCVEDKDSNLDITIKGKKRDLLVATTMALQTNIHFREIIETSLKTTKEIESGKAGIGIIKTLNKMLRDLREEGFDSIPEPIEIEREIDKVKSEIDMELSYINKYSTSIKDDDTLVVESDELGFTSISHKIIIDIAQKHNMSIHPIDKTHIEVRL